MVTVGECRTVQSGFLRSSLWARQPGLPVQKVPGQWHISIV